MKIMAFVVLIFSSVGCFAVSQKLIDGADKYDVAVENLRKIEVKLAIANDSPGYWSKILDESKNASYATDGIRKFYQDKIDESKKQIIDLSIQYSGAKELVKKYEPIKNKYDKQIKREQKREELRAKILDTICTLLTFGVFVLFGYFIISRRKKYKQLLAAGKITQAEYDDMTKCDDESSAFSSMRTNPATGLPMVGIGISDAGGNIRGSSPGHTDYSNSSSSSSFSDYQTYQDRHRWD